MIPDFKRVSKTDKIMYNVSRIGAFVRNPIIGIHRWVGSFDANSLYPSIIRTLNIGFETIVYFDELPIDFKLYIISLKQELNVQKYYGNNDIPIMQYVREYEEFSEKIVDINKLNILDIDRYAIYETTKKVKDEKDIKRISLYKEVLRATIDVLIEKDIVSKLNHYLKKYNLSFAPNFVFFKRDTMSMLNHAMTKYYTQRLIYKDKAEDVTQQIKLKRDELKGELDKLSKKKVKEELETLDIQLTTYNEYSTMYKLLMNAGYGAISHPNCRYFNVDVTNAITSTSQYLMKRCAIDIDSLIHSDTGNKNKSHIIYGDTDSLYIDFAYAYEKFNDKMKFVEYLINEFQPKVESSFTRIVEGMNAYNSTILKMKLEKVGDSSFFQKRKKYVLRYFYKDGLFYIDKPKLAFTGLSAQNINTPDEIEKWCEDGVNHYLNGDKSAFVDFINDIRKKFEQMDIHDVAILRNLNLYDKYHQQCEHDSDYNKIFMGSNYILKKQCPPTVRASSYHNYLIDKGVISPLYKLSDGDKIFIINLKYSKFKEKMIAFGEDEDVIIVKKDIDYDVMFESVVMSNFKPFQDILKWDTKKSADDIFNDIYGFDF